ncbi:MAG TPA: PspC domain-containing protein [Vicinamibacteria bacterium]|nr:PspC domain-containing protein [Vicinamibacteria bacterium]
MIDPSKPIRRSRSGAVAGGVCAGVAAWAGWHPSVVRVAYFLLTAFTGFVPGTIAYLALWLALPPADGS